jgi:hypothetical protein
MPLFTKCVERLYEKPDGHTAYLADKGFSSVAWERKWLAEYGALVAATPQDNAKRRGRRLHGDGLVASVRSSRGS